MNILQMEDMVKGMPDEILMREAQMPSGQIPQFLSLSEIQRRKEMRDKLQAPPQATVADQILQGGIAAAMPQQPPQGGMGAPQGPPMGPPMGPEGAPVMAYGGGQMPYRMYGGGQIPGMVYMQQGQTVPNQTVSDTTLRMRAQNLAGTGEQIPVNMDLISYVKTKLPTFDALPPAAKQEVLARFEPMYNQARSRTEMVKRASTDPQGVLAELEAVRTGTPVAAAIAAPPGAPPAAGTNVGTPPPAPGMPPAGGTTPTAGTDINSMMAELTSAMGPAYAAIAPITGGSTNVSKEFDEIRKLQEQQAGIKTDFSPFVQQIQQRGEESVKRYEQSIKDIEDRMKKERLGAVLTTLGANLMAGEGALGLEKAGKLAQEMGREARQEVAAERRLMEAAREGAADKMLSLQIQQVTSDADAQRNVLNAKTDLQKLILQTNLAQGAAAGQARRDAMQLAATLASSTVGRLKSLEEQNALNTRSFINAMGDISTSVLKLLEGETGVIKPEDRIKRYNELMTRQIRAFAAPFPNIDVESVISAFKQDAGGAAGTTAQSGNPKYYIEVVSPGR